jgi:hypothetical protein
VRVKERFLLLFFIQNHNKTCSNSSNSSSYQASHGSTTNSTNNTKEDTNAWDDYSGWAGAEAEEKKRFAMYKHKLNKIFYYVQFKEEK